MKRKPKQKKPIILARRLLESEPNEDQISINAFKTKLEKHGYMTLTQLEDFCKLILDKLKPMKLKKANVLLETFMIECLQIDKQPTLDDNEKYFDLIAQIHILSQSLNQESVIVNKVIPPWFEKFAETTYLKLVLPTKTDCTNLNVEKNINVASWFTATESITKTCCIQNTLGQNLKIKCPPLAHKPILSTENELIQFKKDEIGSDKLEKPEPNGIIKVRLYPTNQQKKKMDKLFEANRYAWNLLVEKIGSKLFSLKPAEIDEKFRQYVKKSGKNGINPKLSIYSCNEQCFDSAYRDILKARTTIIAASKAQKTRTGKGFQYPDKLKFKSKKIGGNSIEIRSRYITYNAKDRTFSFFKKYFNNTDIKHKTDLAKLGITDFQYSCRLVIKNDEYYLYVPYHRIVKPVTTDKICAMDPGVRTFMTGYDPSGSIFEIASNNQHLYKKKDRIEKLQKLMKTTVNKTKKSRIAQEIRNIYRKITNCVSDMHHKTTKILASTYSEILLPKFGSQNMVSKKDGRCRKINRRTAYNLLTLSHFMFQQLLKHKMNIRKGKLILCTEEYTSKTCGKCGRLNHNLGGSKIFKCPFKDCDLIADRDINAARNIFIKNHNLVNYNLVKKNCGVTES